MRRLGEATLIEKQVATLATDEETALSKKKETELTAEQKATLAKEQMTALSDAQAAALATHRLGRDLFGKIKNSETETGNMGPLDGAAPDVSHYPYVKAAMAYTREVNGSKAILPPAPSSPRARRSIRCAERPMSTNCFSKRR